MTGVQQPLVSANDWRSLRVPALGSWQPTRSVSVVMPAHNPRHLPHVLAALAAQSYPAELLEVIVVDDGSSPPVELPEVRPEQTRLVLTGAGWGRAAACQTGAEVAAGEVLHWLDADMVPRRDEVEAHLRWHHIIDYGVVLGRRLFAPEDAFSEIAPDALREAIADGASPEQLACGTLQPNAWVEQILAETDSLVAAGPRAMRVHVGASGSVTRDLFNDVGGMPVDLILGEDIVLGYRFREGGAVFIPEAAAVSVHPGSSTVLQVQDEVNRYNRPFFADLVPEFRGHRRMVGRRYSVPYVEVVVPVDGADYEGVCALVDAQLSGAVPDVVVTLLAPWSSYADGRRSVLAEPQRDLHMVRRMYAAEARVRFHEAASVGCEATFRLSLPDVRYFPAGRTLQALLRTMEEQHLGLLTLGLPDSEARLERSASAARARRIRPTDPCALDGLVYPMAQRDALDAGFVAATSAPPIRQVPGLVTWGATTKE